MFELEPNFPAMEARILEEAAPGNGRSSSRSCAARPGRLNSTSSTHGPPFANGLPHYGHLLTGFVKDAAPCYETMRGKLVHRRFGSARHCGAAEVEAEWSSASPATRKITGLWYRHRRLPHELRAAVHRQRC